MSELATGIGHPEAPFDRDTPPVSLGLPGRGLDFPTNCERGVKGYPARSYSTGDR